MSQQDQRDNRPSERSPVPSWFLAVVTFPILIGLLWFGRDFLVPIALAALLFILNMALIDRLNAATIAGRPVPRWAAYTAATALVVGLLVALGYSVANQASAMAEAAPKYTERLAALRAQTEGLIGAENLARIVQAIESVDVEAWLSTFAASAAGAIGNVGLILLYLAFMLAERGAFAEKLPRMCATPDEARRVEDILNSISTGVRQYMWINATTSAMSGTLAFIVLSLLGVDFAATLAFSVFLLNFIPSIGSFLAVLFPTIVALLQFDTITPALIVVVVYGGGDAVIGNVVQPRLQGKSLNLSTFVVMAALTFWGMMWGGIGAFIAVPLTVVIMIVCSRIPGLQPYARLLSSDGVLPGEDAGEDATGSDARPNASGHVAAASHPEADIAAEVAAMKQELLADKAARQQTRNHPTDGNPDNDQT